MNKRTFFAFMAIVVVIVIALTAHNAYVQSLESTLLPHHIWGAGDITFFLK